MLRNAGNGRDTLKSSHNKQGGLDQIGYYPPISHVDRETFQKPFLKPLHNTSKHRKSLASNSHVSNLDFCEFFAANLV